MPSGDRWSQCQFAQAKFQWHWEGRSWGNHRNITSAYNFYKESGCSLATNKWTLNCEWATRDTHQNESVTINGDTHMTSWAILSLPGRRQCQWHTLQLGHQASRTLDLKSHTTIQYKSFKVGINLHWWCNMNAIHAVFIFIHRCSSLLIFLHSTRMSVVDSARTNYCKYPNDLKHLTQGEPVIFEILVEMSIQIQTSKEQNWTKGCVVQVHPWLCVGIPGDMFRRCRCGNALHLQGTPSMHSQSTSSIAGANHCQYEKDAEADFAHSNTIWYIIHDILLL